MTRLFPAEVTMTPAAARLHEPDSVLDPGQQAPLDLTVFVSCYNEARIHRRTPSKPLRDALNEVGGISYEIIVVDDRSRDQSSEIGQGLHRRPSRRAHHSPHQQGQPRAGRRIISTPLSSAAANISVLSAAIIPSPKKPWPPCLKPLGARPISSSLTTSASEGRSIRPQSDLQGLYLCLSI